MEHLASYGGSSSSSSDDDYGIAENSKSSAIKKKLPPVSVEFRTISEGPLEDVVKRKRWELSEAPVRPKKAKVQISIPEMVNEEDESDSEGDDEEVLAPNSKIKIMAPNKNPTRLLSLLPKPSQEKTKPKKGSLFVPKSVKKPELKAPKPSPKVEPEKPRSSNLTPSNVPSASKFEPFYREDSASPIPGPNPRADDGPQSDPESAESASKDEPKPGPDSEEGPNPSPGPSKTTKRAVPVISDEKAARLIYKNELEQWGMEPMAPNDIPEIIDVNVDEKLGPNIRANLLKNLPRPGAQAPKSKAELAKDDPGHVAKRKHQINYLAFMAKQREEQLEEQWAQNRHMKRMASHKYGFR